MLTLNEGTVFGWLDSLGQDVRHTVPGMRRAPTSSAVVRQGLVLTAVGSALGLLGAAAVTRSLGGLLFGLTPLDPTTYIGVAIVFAAIATLAASVPAARATRVDPLVALRHD
jgi:putative ABC transport system permease protein